MTKCTMRILKLTGVKMVKNKGSAIDAFMEEIGYLDNVRCQNTAKNIVSFLKCRFNTVPQKIEDAIVSYNDLTALNSLLQCAATCSSINDFKKSLIQK